MPLSVLELLRVFEQLGLVWPWGTALEAACLAGPHPSFPLHLGHCQALPECLGPTGVKPSIAGIAVPWWRLSKAHALLQTTTSTGAPSSAAATVPLATCRFRLALRCQLGSTARGMVLAREGLTEREGPPLRFKSWPTLGHSHSTRAHNSKPCTKKTKS